MFRITQLNFILVCEFFYKFLKWSKLSLINQTELLNKEHEVFKGCVQMCFLAKSYNMQKVLVVDVSVYSEQTLQDCLGNGQEILWKWNTCHKSKQSSTSFTFNNTTRQKGPYLIPISGKQNVARLRSVSLQVISTLVCK